MNTSGANGGNNYTWRARRNCNDDDDDDDDDHNSRLVLRPILGQLNDLVVPSTSYHLLRLPVNYQSRCLSFSLFLSLSLFTLPHAVPYENVASRRGSFCTRTTSIETLWSYFELRLITKLCVEETCQNLMKTIVEIWNTNNTCLVII